MSAGPDLIEAYLDDLLAHLRGAPSEVRRMLAEAESHLRESMADLLGGEGGRDDADAARTAIARFGPAADVARVWNATAHAEPLGAFVRRLAGQLVTLVGVGMVAVGVSGVVARLMAIVWGDRFVFADPPGTQYSASDCRYWLSIHPAAGTCTKAYLAEASADAVLARFVVGAVGVLILGVAVAIRSRSGRPVVAAPPTLTSAIGAAVFAVACLGLIALALESVRRADGNGAGQWLSGAAIALPCAVGYGVAFVRSGRRMGLAT